MLQRTVYTVSSGRELPDVESPLTIELGAGIAAKLSRTEAGGLELELVRAVDRDELEVVATKGRLHGDGTREMLPTLRLRGHDARSHLVGDLLGAIAFLTDVPVTASYSRDGNRFVAENDADHARLADLGTNEMFVPTSATVESRTLGPVEVTTHNLQTVLDRAAGLRIYADALKLSTGVARYRELWRALESAFQRQDDDLVELLAKYPPAVAMSFTADELRRLLVFRGRASHAASKAGVNELVEVERECADRLPRLESLVERVILTKRSWGQPTTGVEELAPLSAYIGPDGGLILRRTGPT